MMETRNNSFENLILLCGVIIVLYKWFESYQEELLSPFQEINWLHVGIYFVIILSSVILLIFAYKRRKQHLERKRAEEEKLQRQEKQLKGLLGTTFGYYSSDETREKLREIKKAISSIPEKITSKYDLNGFYEKVENIISEKIGQENELREREKARIRTEHEEAKRREQEREQKLKESKIEIKKPIIERHGKKLEKSFYRVKDLSEDERLRAISQGFKHYRGIELDGHLCIGGFYIKNNKKESSYHFTAKHLFAELRPNSKIEYGLGDKRADVAYICKDYKLGLEIETGTNKIEQLAAKIPWLERNFSQWIFVCSRKVMGKYVHLVDGKKSFCLSPKRAKEKVLELTAPKCTERI
ncbi:hypothetical protein COV19_02630 [Candidatus Woesearchaeota archaeon CG10_big_fil_rev_8_21_14_0_10_44_13]|nr:MAG: hypothetical protein COV19_02630 [Candidatus Woesearchaeota archaeon CG10_big_fil_rev_8_21_14_0_10_44_13]